MLNNILNDINKIANMIDWKSLLIENYKQMGLNENEVSIILIIDCLITAIISFTGNANKLALLL